MDFAGKEERKAWTSGVCFAFIPSIFCTFTQRNRLISDVNTPHDHLSSFDSTQMNKQIQ